MLVAFGISVVALVKYLISFKVCFTNLCAFICHLCPKINYLLKMPEFKRVQTLYPQLFFIRKKKKALITLIAKIKSQALSHKSIRIIGLHLNPFESPN